MSQLVDACLAGRFPNLTTLVDYGLDGRDGVNPIELFDRYRELVDDGVTADELHHAMTTDTLSRLVGIKVKSGYSCNEMADCHGDVWNNGSQE